MTTIKKVIILNTKNKVPLKCDCFVASVVNSVARACFLGFVSDKPPGYKVFCGIL